LNPKKVEVNLLNALRILHPMHTVLVTCRNKSGKANIITLAWVMPTSINPPLVAISVRPTRYSHRLIEETGEFVVNIPTMEILKATLFCGRRSGEEYDKFKETKLTASSARTVKTPIVEECVAHLECRLAQKFTTGDHTIFVGEVVAAYADAEYFTEEYDVKRAKLVYHLGGDKFTTFAEKVVQPSLEA
jgi:flavin reductase (DIM6/NTAB) family NADH-FMN oxidoreductase RutF